MNAIVIYHNIMVITTTTRRLHECCGCYSPARRREQQDRWNLEHGIGQEAQAERMEASQVDITLGSTGSRGKVDGDA